MRQLVTGVDAAGRSCVMSERDAGFADVAPGLSMDRVFALGVRASPRPPGRGGFVDLGVAPGACSWALWRFEPGADVAVHHTDTVDLDVVLEGTVTLILDDGEHLLATGDCVVVNGVDHGWRAGPDGCVVSAIAIGTPPPG